MAVCKSSAEYAADPVYAEFLTAVVGLGSGTVASTLSAADRQRCTTLAKIMQRRPLIGKIILKLAIFRYERETGQSTAGVPIAAIIVWFIANAGTILTLLLDFLRTIGLVTAAGAEIE